MAATRPPITDDAAYALVDELSAAPLWRHYGNLFPREPTNRATAKLWPYAPLRELALHFCETLSLEEAERRVLMLVNPSLTDPPATVNTLFAGIQIILPGETAQAHRHAANAFRFIIEGSGAYTTVNGERVHMNAGDLLLTPGWHWHDHTHVADGPMMWLDGLDYPLTNALDAGFFELYTQRLQPVINADDISTRQFLHGRLNPAWQAQGGPASPIGNYPWVETERAFAAIADDAKGSASEGILLEYTNPWDGGAVLPTIACRIARLPAAFSGQVRRHTASTIYHVVSGSGRTEIGTQTFEWSEKDTFCIPGWMPYRHQSPAGSDAFLFSFSDEPVLKKLGYYREQWL
ncbi:MULTISPECIES: cupin domain-containing protein [unclassified Mycobacterium]|uniref:cupin domain-containing protein n=1 Tax=unclassified Mycobacterium TaxID=2642494 RepID=UPI0029C7D734|nr:MULTISPECIES: cupin domain-containing protein [unclassified Mycobacterium]